MRIADANAALGAAARLMVAQPAFANLPFGDWIGVLDGQIAREHYGFVVDAADKALGFMGWALATLEKAEAWAGGAPLSSDECREGEILIVNAWVEAEPAVHRFMVAMLRDLTVGKSAFYARRIYADGAARVVRTPVAKAPPSRAERPASTPPDFVGAEP